MLRMSWQVSKNELHSLEKPLGEDIFGELLITTEDVDNGTWRQPQAVGMVRRAYVHGIVRRLDGTKYLKNLQKKMTHRDNIAVHYFTLLDNYASSSTSS